MSDVATAASAPAAAAPKPPQSLVRTLSDGTNQLQFIAVVKKDGSVNSYVVHRENGPDGKMIKSTRGGTVSYETLAKAKEAIDVSVKAAQKQGWSERKGGGGGFKARPDAFDLAHLPSPKAKK
jgi:hypothetical protein